MSRFPLQALRPLLVACVAAAGLAACGVAVSFDDYAVVAADAGAFDAASYDTGESPRYSVRGSVTGLGGAKVVLVLEHLEMEVGDGAFAFPPNLPDGAAFIVTVPSEPAGRVCEVANGTGVIRGSDATGVEVVCRPADATLSLLSLWNTPLEPSFSPTTLRYTATLRRGYPSARFMATTTEPSATFTINAPLLPPPGYGDYPLKTGTNPFEFIVTAPDKATQLKYVAIVTVDGAHYLKASNTRAGALFGASIAIDGDTLAVGAPGEASGATGVNGNPMDASAPDAGAVYIFTRSKFRWSQQAYIKASNARAGAKFGSAIALSGGTLVVGSPSESSAARRIGGDQASTSAVNAGAVYVFQRQGAVWTQESYIKASNASAGAYFGASIGLFEDGVVVGARGESSSAKGVDGDQLATSAPNAGAAYVFRRTAAGWSQESYLKASNTRPNARFGTSVAFSSGDAAALVAIGSPGETSKSTDVGGSEADGGLVGCGAAYVFAKRNGTWAQETYLKPPTALANGAFGTTIAATGVVVAVGWPGDEAIRTFARITPDPWYGQALLHGASYPDRVGYGESLFLFQTSGGNVVGFAGAPRAASGATVNSGTIQPLSEFDVSTVITSATLPRGGARFGASVGYTCPETGSTGCADDDTQLTVVGSPGESSSAVGIDGDQTLTDAPSAGAVYVY